MYSRPRDDVDESRRGFLATGAVVEDGAERGEVVEEEEATDEEEEDETMEVVDFDMAATEFNPEVQGPG